MDSMSLPIPIDVYASLIKECTINCDATRAAELHAHINRSNLRPSFPLFNWLLVMYVSCSCLEVAQKLFDKMTSTDFSSWAIIIAGYVENDDYQKAIYMFVEMLQRQCKGSSIMKFAVSAWILEACVRTMNVGLGKQLHAWLLKMGCAMDLYMGSSMINFFGKFSFSEGANSTFDQMHCHDTVTWTAKIVNHCNEEHFEEVLNIFKEMGKAGIEKNPFECYRACGRLKDDDKQCGRQVHANSIKLGIESSSLFVQCGLVDRYGKRGANH